MVIVVGSCATILIFHLLLSVVLCDVWVGLALMHRVLLESGVKLTCT